jgi:hypothetical protein
MARRIFQAIGMTSTRSSDPRTIIPNGRRVTVVRPAGWRLPRTAGSNHRTAEVARRARTPLQQRLELLPLRHEATRRLRNAWTARITENAPVTPRT